MSIPIMMAEETWINSYFSVARFYGGMKFNGHTYLITDAHDLLRDDFFKYYKKLGRARFIEILKDHQHDDDLDLKKVFKEEIEKQKAEKKEQTKEQDLFK